MHGRSGSAFRWLKAALALTAFLTVAAAATAPAFGEEWVQEYPYGTMHAQPSIVAVGVFTPKRLDERTAVIRIDGVAQRTFVVNVGTVTGHWSSTETQDPATGAWTIHWTWTADTGGASMATLYCYPTTQADGTKTVGISVADVGGTAMSDSWQFKMGLAPTLGRVSPAAGSTLTTTSPVFTVPVADDTAVGSWNATVGGVPADAALASGVLRIVPHTAIANDATATLELTVRDAGGNTACASWDYYVQKYASMPGDYSDCLGCHPGQHGATSDSECPKCHVPQGDIHTGSTTALHSRAVLSAECGPCHVSALLSEHGRYPGVTCLSCHASTSPTVVAAIAAGDSRCTSCHTNLSNGGHTTIHDTVVATETLAGTSLQCGACHDGNLMIEHAKPAASSAVKGCTACHPSPRDTVVTFDRTTCVQAGCHAAGGAQTQHGGMTAAHAVTSSPGCIASGCHSGSDLAAIHSNASTTTPEGTRTGCLVCHSDTSVPASGACSSCHDTANPHGDETALHAADPSVGTVQMFDSTSSHTTEAGYVASVDVHCDFCHYPNLLTIHSRNCAWCHGSSTPAVQAAVTRPFASCWDCHTSAHATASANHDAAYAADECDYCHDPSFSVDEGACGNCHTLLDLQPPVTTSDARSSYIGPARITLYASDPYPSDGLAATYYRLDGGAQTTGTVLDIPAPAAGSAAHTLEYWSVDNAGHTESPHATASFTVTADTSAPHTSSNAKASYDGIARITLTAVDDATQFGVKTTYYRLDGGIVNTGTSITVPAPSSTTNHTLEFWSEDWSGNIEVANMVTFVCTADTLPPVTTLTLRRYIASNILYGATLSAVDVGDSGVAYMWATIDNGGPVLKTMGGASNGSPMSLGSGVLPEGWYNLRYWAIDQVGNESSHDTTTFCLDQHSPTISYPFTYGGTFVGTTTIQPSLVDTASGVNPATIRYSLSYYDAVQKKSVYCTGTTDSFVATPPAAGSRYYSGSWQCYDNAGNYGTNGIGFYIAR